MTTQRCTHCGLEGDPEVEAIPHKSTCRSAGKDSDYVIVGSTKPMTTAKEPPKSEPEKVTKSSSKTKSKSSKKK